MRIIVVGGAGAVGRAAVAALSGRHDIVVAGRRSGSVRVDIRSADSVRAMYQEVGRFDAVVCAAGDAHLGPLDAMSEAEFGVGIAAEPSPASLWRSVAGSRPPRDDADSQGARAARPAGPGAGPTAQHAAGRGVRSCARQAHGRHRQHRLHPGRRRRHAARAGPAARGSRRARRRPPSEPGDGGAAAGQRRGRRGRGLAGPRPLAPAGPATLRRDLRAHGSPGSPGPADRTPGRGVRRARIRDRVTSGGDFTTPIDTALAALGHRRKVVLSVASFLFLPEIVSSCDLVALVPRRLLRSPREQLTVIDLPWLAGQFRVRLLWHERTHTHAGHRWIRERIAELATGRQEAPAPSGHIAPRQRRGRSADRGE